MFQMNTAFLANLFFLALEKIGREMDDNDCLIAPETLSLTLIWNCIAISFIHACHMPYHHIHVALFALFAPSAPPVGSVLLVRGFIQCLPLSTVFSAGSHIVSGFQLKRCKPTYHSNGGSVHEMQNTQIRGRFDVCWCSLIVRHLIVSANCPK